MENTLATILMAICLLVGALGGVVLTPEQDCPVVDPIVEYQNVSVTEYVDVPAVSQLDLAVAEFLQAVEDEEDEAGNNVDVLGTYDFDEMEVSRIYSDHNVSYEDEKTTIDFKIRLRFDEEDSKSKKQIYNVKVIFDEDEDTEVEAILI
ncbi:MAG: hypothetical protein ACTSQA_00115 [Candidatus Heimdallarchaeaceae archaeon]